MGTLGVEDGCPTLDELTLDGVPNIRTVVSDVLMDVPLYMTPRYRELMTNIISREINRVYRLFSAKNPEFAEKGKVSIFGHSLGVCVYMKARCRNYGFTNISSLDV